MQAAEGPINAMQAIATSEGKEWEQYRQAQRQADADAALFAQERRHEQELHEV